MPFRHDVTGSAEIPDYMSALSGWRSWNYFTNVRTAPKFIDVDGTMHGKLLSLNAAYGWVPRERQEASCDRNLNHTGSAPVQTCTCGIYCCKDVARLKGMGYTRHPILGEMAIWGKIVEHDFGYRSQFAYPKRLYANVTKIPLDLLEAEQYLMPLVDYGVPVFLRDEQNNAYEFYDGKNPPVFDAIIAMRKGWYERALTASKLLLPALGDRVWVRSLKDYFFIHEVDKMSDAIILKHHSGKITAVQGKDLRWQPINSRWEIEDVAFIEWTRTPAAIGGVKGLEWHVVRGSDKKT